MRDLQTLAAAVPGATVVEGLLLVPAEGIVAALEALKKLGGFMLFDISAVDRPPVAPAEGVEAKAGAFEVSYRLMDMKKDAKDLLTVRVVLPHEDPALPSVVGVWKAADVLEREAWDLMGIKFDGRDKLERILLKDDFIGHPLRKDFVAPKRERFLSPAWDRKAAEGGL